MPCASPCSGCARERVPECKVQSKVYHYKGDDCQKRKLNPKYSKSHCKLKTLVMWDLRLNKTTKMAHGTV